MDWFAQNYHHLLFTDFGGFAFVLVLYLVLGIFEIAFPAEPGQTFSGRITNVIVTGIFLGLGGYLTKLSISALGAGPRHLVDHGILVSAAILIGYGFTSDLFFYWYHRAQHKIDFLWPIHELHHTETALNATTSLRTFWLEAPLQSLIIALPATYIIGLDHRAAFVLPALFTGWLYFTHANWRLSLGPLTPLICGPQLHRIHHSNLGEHQNKNFAQYFPFIDMMFGTYYAPRRGEFPTTGIPNRTAPASPAEITIGPLLAWTAAVDARLSSQDSVLVKPAPKAASKPRPQASRQRRRAR